MTVQAALSLTEAMLAAVADDDWRTCAELARLRAPAVTGAAAAAGAADLSRLLARNGELLVGIERLRARTHQDLLALRRGSAARDRYHQAPDR